MLYEITEEKHVVIKVLGVLLWSEYLSKLNQVRHFSWNSRANVSPAGKQIVNNQAPKFQSGV